MDDADSAAPLDSNHAVDEGKVGSVDTEASEQDEPFELDHEVLGVYQQRMTLLFPDLAKRPSPQPAAMRSEAAVADDHDGSEDEGTERPMTKKEKQTAKRRRQRERQRIAEAQAEEEERLRAEEERSIMEAEPILFRLYSSCPVMPVQIVRQPEIYPIPSNPLHLPLDEAIYSRIRRVAAESAVAGPSASNLSFDRSRSMSSPCRTFHLTQAAAPLPPYFIGEIDNPARADALMNEEEDQPLLSATNDSGKTANKLVLTPADQSLSAPRAKRRSRGRRRSGQDTYRPPPRFYAPPSGLGGKSRGYAWGWRDSQEGMREHEHGYLRS